MRVFLLGIIVRVLNSSRVEDLESERLRQRDPAKQMGLSGCHAAVMKLSVDKDWMQG